MSIFTNNSECRRKAKDYDKYYQSIAKRDPSCGLYPLDAIKGRNKQPPTDYSQTIPYFDDIESNARMILDIFDERKHTFPQSLHATNCNYALKVHESYDNMAHTQKQIASMLSP